MFIERVFHSKDLDYVITGILIIILTVLHTGTYTVITINGVGVQYLSLVQGVRNSEKSCTRFQICDFTRFQAIMARFKSLDIQNNSIM